MFLKRQGDRIEVLLRIHGGATVMWCSHLINGYGGLLPQFSAWLPNSLGFMPHFFISRVFYGLSKMSIEIHPLKLPLFNVGHWVWDGGEDDLRGKCVQQAGRCQLCLPSSRHCVLVPGLWPALGMTRPWTDRRVAGQTDGLQTHSQLRSRSSLVDRWLLFCPCRAFWGGHWREAAALPQPPGLLVWVQNEVPPQGADCCQECSSQFQLRPCQVS